MTYNRDAITTDELKLEIMRRGPYTVETRLHFSEAAASVIYERSYDDGKAWLEEATGHRDHTWHCEAGASMLFRARVGGMVSNALSVKGRESRESGQAEIPRQSGWRNDTPSH